MMNGFSKHNPGETGKSPASHSGTISTFNNTGSTPVEQTTGLIAFTLVKNPDASQPSASPSSKSTRVIVKPKLEVVRGEKMGVQFTVLEGRNILGRTVNSPVDLDLTGQETAERVWSSRQHACLSFDGRSVILEDLNSLNGTFVNRQRVFPGQQRVLQAGDVVQIGTVQLRLNIQIEKLELELS